MGPAGCLLGLCPSPPEPGFIRTIAPTPEISVQGALAVVHDNAQPLLPTKPCALAADPTHHCETLLSITCTRLSVSIYVQELDYYIVDSICFRLWVTVENFKNLFFLASD